MNTKLALVLSVTLGAIAAIGVYSWMNEQKIEHMQKTDPVQILSVRNKVNRGEPLKSRDCMPVMIPKDYVVQGMIPYVERYRFFGKTASRDLDPKRPVFEEFMTNVKKEASLARLAVQPGMRAVTIRVDNVAGVAGLIRPGDYVDVVLTGGTVKKDDKIIRDYTKSYYLLQAAKVLAIDNQILQADESRFDKRMYRTVTLELRPADALRLVNAQGSRTGIQLQMILRNPSETKMVEGLDPSEKEYQKPNVYWDLSEDFKGLRPAE